MHKLSGTSSYTVGLNIGETSVGFAAVDDGGGEVLFHKGKPVMGVHLYNSAKHADGARGHRTARRTLRRKQGRVREIERIFEPAVAEVDSGFFVRRHMSALVPADAIEAGADLGSPADRDFKALLGAFPTPAHLRVFLMETNHPADVRLIEHVFAHAVSKRGNFYLEGNDGVSAEHSQLVPALVDLGVALDEYLWGEQEAHFEVDVDAAAAACGDKALTTAALCDALDAAFTVVPADPDLCDVKAMARLTRAAAALCVGYKANIQAICPDVPNDRKSCSVANSDELDAVAAEVPDELVPILEAAANIYMALKLQDLLSFQPGKTISYNLVGLYDKYRSDLRLLKDTSLELVVGRDARGELNVDGQGYRDHNAFFCGPRKEGEHAYDKYAVIADMKRGVNRGFTAYNLKVRPKDVKGGAMGDDYDLFAQNTVKYLVDHGLARVEVGKDGKSKTFVSDIADVSDILEGLRAKRFCRRVCTPDSRAIPFQLNAEELERIIDNQGRFHSFLLENKDHIMDVFRCRVPYYIGPLSTDGAPVGSRGRNRFAWSERKAGHEDARVSPWNIDEHIDRKASAESFIRRMTGECSYLIGEDTLPKCSLLYQEYCFRDELAGLKVTFDGDDERPLSRAERNAVMEVARHRNTVSYAAIEALLSDEAGGMKARLVGRRTNNGKDEASMASKLSSYNFFAHVVLGKDALTGVEASMCEEIILWNTLFEDRKMLRETIEEAFGEVLTPEQVDKICRKRLSGWGAFSERLLDELTVKVDGRDTTIMDILRDGYPFGKRRGRAVNFMQIVTDSRLGFSKAIEEENQAYADSFEDFEVTDLPGSPALQRAVSKAIAVVDDIAEVAGKNPSTIFYTNTRNSRKAKGKKTVSRQKRLAATLKEAKKEYGYALDVDALLAELSSFADDDAFPLRAELYFHQGGRDLYTGERLSLAAALAGDYELDHIIAPSYRKDDSSSNLALVQRSSVNLKGPDRLLTADVRVKMSAFWRTLVLAGLMSKKKQVKLTCSEVKVQNLSDYLNRQLVEAGQYAQLFKLVASRRYPGCKIHAMKPGASGGLRAALSLPKVPAANGLHSAHDALFAASMGRYIKACFPEFFSNRFLHEKLRSYLDDALESRKMSEFDFFLRGFFLTHADRDTGEVIWDAEQEVAQLEREVCWKNLSQVRDSYSGDQVNSNGFWKMTAYSPRNPAIANLQIPRKENLPCDVYGGYTSTKFAYFFIYEYEDKRGKRSVAIAGVPNKLAADVERDPRLLDAEGMRLSSEAGKKFVKVLFRRVLKKQVFEAYGEEFFVSGLAECAPAGQLVFRREDQDRLYTAMRYGTLDPSRLDVEEVLADLDWLFGETMSILARRRPHSYSRLGVERLLTPSEAWRRALEDKPSADRGKLLTKLCREVSGIVSYFAHNTGAKAMELTLLGGSGIAKVNPGAIAKLIMTPEAGFAFVNRSAAGLRETRVKAAL